MKKYSNIVRFALCLGFVGNVAWGQETNEGQNIAVGNDVDALVIPEQGNLTTSDALKQLLQAAQADYNSFSSLTGGEDFQNTIFLINQFLDEPLENKTLESLFSAR